MNRRTTNRLLAAVLAVAAVLLIPAAGAQPPSTLPSYDVELVIFRHLSSNASPEQWEAELGSSGSRIEIPDEEQTPFGSSSPAPMVETTTTFPALAPAKYKLTAVADTLRRSRNYQPLAHIGWTQPGYARDSARFFSITELVPASSGLSGRVALSRGRFLHLTLDLHFDAADAATDPQRYVLRQTRRMRSNERHYIDHPKFGVIAVITPGGE